MIYSISRVFFLFQPAVWRTVRTIVASASKLEIFLRVNSAARLPEFLRKHHSSHSLVLLCSDAFFRASLSENFKVLLYKLLKALRTKAFHSKPAEDEGRRKLFIIYKYLKNNNNNLPLYIFLLIIIYVVFHYLLWLGIIKSSEDISLNWKKYLKNEVITF